MFIPSSYFAEIERPAECNVEFIDYYEKGT